MRGRLRVLVAVAVLLAALSPVGAAADSPTAATIVSDDLAPQAASTGTAYAGFTSMTKPERLLDTRTGLGAAPAPVGPGQSIRVQFAGRGNVPADVTAVVMNVTADAPSQGGFVTVYPAGEPVPGTSNINLTPGKTVPNLVVMQLNAGAASFYNAFGTTHLLADVLAYARDDGHFVGFSPQRFLDTRSGVGASVGKVVAGGHIDVSVLGWGSVPTDASTVSAVVMNVTVDQPMAPSFVTVWPTGEARPNASSLNMTAGQTVANLVFAPVGPDGSVSFFNESGETNLVGDIVGWIPRGAAYIPITPTRVLDTRIGLGTDLITKHEGPLAPGESILFSPYDANFSGSVASDQSVGAYVLNVTAAGPTAKSFLTVYPLGQTLPDASNLNTVPGENVPNAVVVRPGIAGVDVIRNDAGFTHVIVDIVGIVPRQNARDAVDDVGGSRFHVVYLLGSDSVEDSAMPAKIRAELEAANTWMANETGGAALDFGRVNGEIDVTTWRLSGYTEDQIAHWETVQEVISGHVFYPVMRQLHEDGFGFPVDQRVLVYLSGTRTDGWCGATLGQFATVFTHDTGCPAVVDGWSGDPLTVGNAPGTELIALRGALSSLGALRTCGAASTDMNDVLSTTPAVGFPKHIDAGRNIYFGHSNPNCPDVARSPFLTNVPG